MSLGACVIANEPAGLKDALLQARIEGKSWSQIATEFNLGSPSAARSTFKKLTGVTDFKIKGQALANIVNKGMIDDLKKAVPKKPPKGNPGAHTTAATQGAAGVGQQATQAVIFNADEAKAFYTTVKNGQLTQARQLELDMRGKLGGSKYEAILADIKAGKYYSDIVSKYGVGFDDVDGVFWSSTAKQNTGNVWNAYVKKPTSEFGFKAVQDTVWDMRRAGATVQQIHLTTGIDESVVKLILDNKWTLPGKGSKTYVTTPSGGGAQSWSTTTTQLIGESNSFKNMTSQQAASWADSLGMDLTARQVSNIKSYTGSFYTQINTYLRTGSYSSQRVAEAIEDLTSAMRPMPESVTLRRGVGREAFPGGVPSVGDAYTDKAFMSTSYGNKAAFSGKPYILVIDAPAGTMARPLQKISGFGESEREILLNRNTKFVVTGVESSGGQTTVYMRAVP